MNICIIGAGVVGSFLAEKLAKEGTPVSVIDTDSVNYPAS
jgi:Trk K+ transport system NAD-binding subunit